MLNVQHPKFEFGNLQITSKNIAMNQLTNRDNDDSNNNNDNNNVFY